MLLRVSSTACLRLIGLPFASRVAAATQFLLVFYSAINERTPQEMETATYKPLVKESIQICVPEADGRLLQ
jgi:hypothetical protein